MENNTVFVLILSFCSCNLCFWGEKSAHQTAVFTFVRSMPRRTWESRCMMTLLCSSTDSPSGSSSRSSWLSNSSEIRIRGASNDRNSTCFSVRGHLHVLVFNLHLWCRWTWMSQETLWCLAVSKPFLHYWGVRRPKALRDWGRDGEWKCIRKQR